MVGCVYKLNNGCFSQKVVHCKDYRNYDLLLMKNDIRQSNINEVDRIGDVNEAWNHFKNILIEAFQRHAPLIKERVCGKPFPWLGII